MATPAGWSQRTNPKEYEAILIRGEFKYEVNVNVETGQRQIYTIDPIIRTREFVGTINADGTTVRQEAWNNIGRLPNGQTRLKDIIDTSRIAANKLVKEAGTPAEIERLREQKEYRTLQGQTTSPPGRNPNQQDNGNDPSNTGENPGTAGNSGGGGSTLPDSISFQREEFGTGGDYGNIVYPSKSNPGQDRILITQFKYKTADVFGGDFATSNTAAILGGTDLSSRTFEQIFGSVSLPMPNNITEANETAWGSNELSTLSAAALGAGIKGAEALTSLDGAALVKEIGEGLSGLRSSGASETITKLLTLRAGSAIVSKIGLNVDPSAYLARATGTVVNPNLELLFTGPKLRSFNYQIKMSPRNKEDAKRIRQIIKFFKKGMAPQRAQTNTTGFFLGAPNVFSIKFYSGNTELKSIGQIKMCALTSFNVDYTPDGSYASINDPEAGGSQPVSTNISLTFSELTPVYEDNYNVDDHAGFGDEYDPAKIDSPELSAGEANPPSGSGSVRGSQPSAGGASDVTAPATRVFQQGGPTATPGVDTPAQGSGRLGSEPTFSGGVRGI